MTFASETSVKAVRKRHVCDGCGKHIEIGSPAKRWAGMTDGDFGAVIYHVECRAAEIDYNDNVLGHCCGDEWQCIGEIEDEDWSWLLDEHPVVAARMNIAKSPDQNAGSEAAGEAPGGTR